MGDRLSDPIPDEGKSLSKPDPDLRGTWLDRDFLAQKIKKGVCGFFREQSGLADGHGEVRRRQG